MKTIFRLREFPVYKSTRKFRNELHKLIKDKFPKEERYSLTSQVFRATDSILLNIAEGADRLSDIDFSRFLNLALTSVNEVVACMDLAIDSEYISKKEYDYFVNQLENIHKQLKGFISKVRKDNQKF